MRKYLSAGIILTCTVLGLDSSGSLHLELPRQQHPTRMAKLPSIEHLEPAQQLQDQP